jgi:hypothetical protein
MRASYGTVSLNPPTIFRISSRAALAVKLFSVKLLSIITPEERKVEKLFAGQIGLVGIGMNMRNAIIGDTNYLKETTVRCGHPSIGVVVDFLDDDRFELLLGCLNGFLLANDRDKFLVLVVVGHQ